jgi:hypothetical protein
VEVAVLTALSADSVGEDDDGGKGDSDRGYDGNSIEKRSKGEADL